MEFEKRKKKKSIFWCSNFIVIWTGYLLEIKKKKKEDIRDGEDMFPVFFVLKWQKHLFYLFYVFLSILFQWNSFISFMYMSFLLCNTNQMQHKISPWLESVLLLLLLCLFFDTDKSLYENLKFEDVAGIWRRLGLKVL